MDIPEMSFERIPGVNRVRASGMKHQVDRAYRLVHGMHNRQPRLRDRYARVGGTAAYRFP
jgi:hypothetical protein